MICILVWSIAIRLLVRTAITAERERDSLDALAATEPTVSAAPAADAVP
ncbi:MAG TPA: hypothetical protein VEP49_03880 [Acidimicrobiia bacterium]|nr:hypothetical protein [Acidimicrobiia bacterium]